MFCDDRHALWLTTAVMAASVAAATCLALG